MSAKKPETISARDAERKIARIVKLRQEQDLTNAQIAKEIGWPGGRVDAVTAQLIKRGVIKKASRCGGIVATCLGVINSKYGKL